MKQCFTHWSFANRGIDDDVLFLGAYEIGFTGIELLPTSLFERAIDLGLEIVTHGGHSSIAEGLNDPANHARIRNEVEANLALAQRYRIQKLIVFSGNRRPGITDAEAADHTIVGLTQLAPLAESAGVPLVMELLNSKRDHPGYQCDTTRWSVPVAQAVNSPYVGILFDIYHAQVMEGDLVRTIQQDGVVFGHYHTAGNPGRHDLDETQEIYYPAVFRAIAQSGYEGYIGHEFMPVGNPLTSLQQAYGLCQSTLK